MDWPWTTRAALPIGILLACVAASAGSDRECLDAVDVCLEFVARDDGTTRFVAHNATALPYSFRVAFPHLRNLEPDGPVPFRAVVEPGGQQLLGSLRPDPPDRATGWRSSWGAARGSMLARPDVRFRYRMPFGGDAPRILSQGVGGVFSHQGPARHSFDFSMPSGTPVLAARDGVVVAVRDAHQDSGRRKLRYDQANAVEVLHDDGTVAVYAHLRRGAQVEVGERVSAGDRVGLSGDSGYSTGPHLHFMVWRRLADLGWESVPIRFDDGSTAGFVPAEGVAYQPACTEAGGPCGSRPSALPARPAPTPAPARGGFRREDGACECANGAVIHVDLPCSQVCGR